MALDDLLARAAREARDLGHPQLGTEHLLLALVATESASGQALRACDLSYEAVRDAVSGLSVSYLQRTLRDDPASSTPRNWLVHDPDTQRVHARAEGLAAGLGSTEVRDEHELLALVRDPASPVALQLMEKLGATRERVLEELRRRGVEVPDVPLPYRPSWGAPFYVSREEFERLAADLRRRGVLYRYNWKGERVIVSIDEKSNDRGRRPSYDE
jgi:ATP-dependent Clp protease ATP-binding subunit ClpA